MSELQFEKQNSLLLHTEKHDLLIFICLNLFVSATGVSTMVVSPILICKYEGGMF